MLNEYSRSIDDKPTDAVARTSTGLQAVRKRLALTEVDEVGVIAGTVSLVTCFRHEGASLRSRCSLPIFCAAIEPIRLTTSLHVGRIECQSVVVSATATATAIVVVLAILVVVLAVLTILTALTILAALTVLTTLTTLTTLAELTILALSAELGVGDTSCKQQRDKSRVAHDKGLGLESKLNKRVNSGWRLIREKDRYVQRNLDEEIEEGRKRNVTLNWQTSNAEETSNKGW